MPPPPESALVDLERQISEAAQLKIALSRGEVSRVKQDVRLFLGDSALFRDLVPERWWRADHTSTQALEDALLAAKDRIAALPVPLLPGLLALTEAYADRAGRLVAAQDAGTKTEVKTEALDYLEHHADLEIRSLYPVAGLRDLVGRRNHVASETVLEALLKARARIDVSLQDAHAEIERHILSIDPFAGKAHLKAEILFLFETHFTRSRLPSTMGYTRYVRKSHAPARDLHKALIAAKSALESVATSDARAKANAVIDRYCFLLRSRKKMQLRAAECAARALLMRDALQSSYDHVAQRVAEVQKKRTQVTALLATVEADNDRTGEALVRTQARLESGRDELSRLGDQFEAQRAAGASELVLASARLEVGKAEGKVRVLELEEGVLLAQIDTLKAKATALLVTLDQLAQVELHCTERAASLQNSLVRAKAAFAKYEQVKTLVFYFGTRDNIFEKLLAVGRFLKGGRDDVDAMGSISIVFLFEAGVRVGVELGIVNLNAKVALTLMLGGTLSILDSRELMFAHRVGVYATASTEASIGGGKQIGELLHAPIEVPDKLLEASARVRCRLYDCEACHVYENEEHWAFTWAHEIARRIAFLRGYTVTDPACAREGGGDWVEQSLRELVATGITASDGSVSPRDGDAEDWRTMLRVEMGLIRVNLRDKPVRVVRFDQPFAVEGSARVSAAGLGELSFDRETPIGQATFDASVEATGSTTALGTLVEDSAVYCYAPEGERRMGATIFHRFKTPGQRDDEPGTMYLELTDKEANRVGTDTFNFQWSASRGKSVGTAAQRCALARVLREARVPPEFVRKVGLPALVTGPKPDATDDLTALAKRMRFQLDLLVGKHPVGAGEKAANRLFAAPETLGGASAKLTSVATALEKAPSLLASSPLPASTRGSVGGFASDVRDRVAPLAHGASNVLADVADKVSFLSEIQVALGASSSSYARYVGQPRFAVVSGRIDWHVAWTPQVFRGTNLKIFSLRLESDVPVAPLVAVFFKFELQFRKEYAEYEVLGLDTLSYLKTLRASFRGVPGRSARYWELHGEELVEICRHATDPTSGVFAEVVHDMAKGAEEAKASARHFGRTCWASFLPNETNPFAGTTPFDAATLIRMEKCAERFRAAQAGRTPEALLVHRDALLEADGTEAFVEAWRADMQAAADLGTKYAASFPKFGRPEAVGVDLPRDLMAVAEARRSQREDATRRFARGFASLDVEGLKLAATDLADGFAVSIAIHEQEHAALWSRAFSGGTDFPSMVRDAATAAEPERDLLGDLFRPLIDRLGEATRIPDPTLWLTRSRENISYFQVRSTATKALDEAVGAFHCSLAAWHREMLLPLRTQRADIQSKSEEEWLNFARRLRAAIQSRLNAIGALEGGLGIWKGGRDPAKSERTPNVCMFLERPMRIERASLCLLERLLSLRLTILDHIGRRTALGRVGKPPAPNVTLLRAALDRYLDATYGQFANHALFHGIKKLRLPGEEREIEKLEDDEPAQTTTAASVSAVQPSA